MSRSGIEQDLGECRAILGRGSKSFALAARVLPRRLRDPVAAYYAFCRVSDDAVDESDDPQRELARLRERVTDAYEGRPHEHPADRALAWVARAHGLPRVTIEALLEGYQWDVERRRYGSLSETLSYCVRVASSVGVAMTALMGIFDRDTLARAADLGAAMQLVNIARDVGEDARRGRVYLPEAWLEREGLSSGMLLSEPVFDERVGAVVRRLLAEANVLARRAEAGIASLPADCRWAIRAAAWIYLDIGRVIREREYDSVGGRAVTSRSRKLWLMGAAAAAEAFGQGAASARSEVLPEAVFLIEAAAR